MSKPLKIYLDTSIPNVATAEEDSDRSRITKLLLEETAKGSFIAYISAVVVTEIKDTKDANRREQLLEAIAGIKHKFLDITPAIRRLAEEYIREGIIPEEYGNDALHIAAATAALVPNIVTWNLKHMANLKTMSAVNRVNASLGYPQLHILTPYELVGHLLDEPDF